jgi:hypothetical protein
MRTIMIASAFVGFALAGLVPLQASEDARIAYATNLQCAGCIRGAYVFCGKTMADSQCLKADDIEGIKKQQDAGYTCTDNIKTNNVYLAYEICDQYNNLSCGSKGVESTLVDLYDNKTIIDRDLFLEYSQGCAYRVVSRCGFPQINITHSGYDVGVVIHGGDSTPEGDPQLNYEFLGNESISFNFIEGSNSKKFVWKYPGLDDNST